MEQYADVKFPERGLDLGRSLNEQAPGTTASAVNVRLFEPSTLRARGGSRPGLSKQPAGGVPAAAIQDLNIVLYVDALAMGGSYPPPDLDPVTGLPPIDDPSSAGDPGSWGVGQPTDGVTGLPALDPDTGDPLPPFPTRNPHGGLPGGGTQPPRKKREGGDGFPPNPNVLMYRPESGGPKRIFFATEQIKIHGGLYDGQQPAFASDNECHPYNPGVGVGPTTFEQFPTGVRKRNDFLAMASPYSSYEVLSETIHGPGAVC